VFLVGNLLLVFWRLSINPPSGSTCKQGEAQAIVISTGGNTLFGRAVPLVGREVDTTRHLDEILTKIGSFCLAVVGIFVLVEILVLYAGFRYSYRRGLDNILVLLIGGIPIAMPTALSVILAAGVQQLAKHNAIVTRISAIEDLADITVLCSNKTGTLTTDKPTVEKDMIKTYSLFSPDEVVMLAAYASRMENQVAVGNDAKTTCNPISADDVILRAAYASEIENQDATNMSIIQATADASCARAGIEFLDFKPFDPVCPCAKVTYCEQSSGKVMRVAKGMPGIILRLCDGNKVEELENRLEADVEEFAKRGMSAVAVAYQELSDDDNESKGHPFEFVGFLPMFDPPRADTKKAIDDAVRLGVKVKMVTSDWLCPAKETGRRIGLGDDMYPAMVLDSGPVPGGKHASLEEMIMDADGFAGMNPVRKCELMKRLQRLGQLCAMTGYGDKDVPALSEANVGIAVKGATDANRRDADVVLTEPGLLPIIHAIRGSRIVIQRMRSYSIYACANTIRIGVCFAILAFTYSFEFPPFMILVTALLNDGMTMILSADHVLPSVIPDALDLLEIFSYAIAYGVYLAMST
jgi:H+-transporting ATPase